MEGLSVKDYLDAAADAAKRTRAVVIIIVSASVLMFAGFLNSLSNTWMLERVRALSVPGSEYAKQKFPELSSDPPALAHAQELFYDSIMKSYVENTFTIRVPFFGITFDVNDLGLLGGVAFIILLILFRFSLATEFDNTVLAFEEAKAVKQLVILYDLLAMRQVLSTPPLSGKESPQKMLMMIPKALSVLPLTVLTVVIAHDFITYSIGASINIWHTLLLYIVGAALWAFVLILTVSCLMLWLRIDEAWRKYWREVQAARTLKLAPRPDQRDILSETLVSN